MGQVERKNHAPLRITTDDFSGDIIGVSGDSPLNPTFTR
jgi:hypothetical protein